MRNIKEIRAERDALREEYEAKVALLEQEIVAVRGARGYVPRAPVYEEFYEQGRSAERTHG